MVQSKLQSVDLWMETVEERRRPALTRLRALCSERLGGWVEQMRWGMPGYGPEGADPVVSFNNQKQHISFYAGTTTVASFADRLSGLDCGRGCVRYRRTEQMNFEVIGDMLDDIHRRGGPMC